MRSNTQALRLTVLTLMAVIELIFSFTPLGTIPLGPLAVTLNILPIAVSAVIMGPIGGGALGAFFGFLSYLQCYGVGVSSEFGAALIAESSGKTAAVCILPRLLTGIIAGFAHYLLKEKVKANSIMCGAAAGFCAAIFNTILFMSALVLLLGDTDTIKNIRMGQNLIVFIFAFVGVNALIEMLFSTIVTALTSLGMDKTGLFKK